MYDEQTFDDAADPPPIDTAIEEGWAEIAEPRAYVDSFVSSAMDGVRRFIATVEDHPSRCHGKLKHADEGYGQFPEFAP